MTAATGLPARTTKGRGKWHAQLSPSTLAGLGTFAAWAGHPGTRKSTTFNLVSETRELADIPPAQLCRRCFPPEAT